MEYKEKFHLTKELLDERYIDNDMALLREVSPSSPALSRVVTDNNRAMRAEEVVWALLDKVTPFHIRLNREPGSNSSPAVASSPAGAAPKPVHEKKKLPKKSSTPILRGLAYISTMCKKRISSITIGCTPISKWLSSIKSWISDLRKKT